MKAETLPKVRIESVAITKTQGGVDSPLPIAMSCQLAMYSLNRSLQLSGATGSAPPEISPNLYRDQKRVTNPINEAVATTGRVKINFQERCVVGVKRSSSSSTSISRTE